MSHGGKRPGAGRKPGAASKKTREIADKAALEGITPLDYMLSLLRDASNDPLTRFEAAKAAAPYVHPRLSSQEIKGSEDKPLTVQTVERIIVRPQTSDPNSGSVPPAA